MVACHDYYGVAYVMAINTTVWYICICISMGYSSSWYRKKTDQEAKLGPVAAAVTNWGLTNICAVFSIIMQYQYRFPVTVLDFFDFFGAWYTLYGTQGDIIRRGKAAVLVNG